MKILIIEDSLYKIDEINLIFKTMQLDNYEIVDCVKDAHQKVANNNYDLIISDLGLPKHKDGYVNNALEGLEMLFDFAIHKISIPTIIFSATNILEEDILSLRELDYPLLGHATDPATLENLIEMYISNQKLSNTNNTNPENKASENPVLARKI